jgi:hypothetical protein
LLVDIHDYQQHPSVETLIAVVYDLASTFDNPQDSRPTSRAATTTST